MYKTAKATVSPEGEEGRQAWWLLRDDAGPTTDGALGAARLAAGADTPVHRHPDGEEAVVVLAGEGVATTSAGEHRVGPGSVLFAPRGAWHGLRASDAGLELLVIFGGVPNADAAGYEEPDGELVDTGHAATVRQIEDVEEHSAHNPELGFFHIRARFVVDDEIGAERLVVGQARSEALRGLHELHRHEHGAEFFCLLEGEATHIGEDGAEIPFRAGDVTYTAAGEWHGMRNVGEIETRAIFGFFGVENRMAAGYEVRS